MKRPKVMPCDLNDLEASTEMKRHKCYACNFNDLEALPRCRLCGYTPRLKHFFVSGSTASHPVFGSWFFLCVQLSSAHLYFGGVRAMLIRTTALCCSQTQQISVVDTAALCRPYITTGVVRSTIRCCSYNETLKSIQYNTLLFILQQQELFKRFLGKCFYHSFDGNVSRRCYALPPPPHDQTSLLN